MIKVLMVASEAVPFIKTGGLADVVGSLPKYIDKTKYDVRVILPKYSCMKDEYKKKLSYKTNFFMDLGWRSQYVGIFECKFDGMNTIFPGILHIQLTVNGTWKDLYFFQRRFCRFCL